MPCIEVFAAGDSLVPTAGGRTGSRGRDRRVDVVGARWWRLEHGQIPL